MALQLRLQQRLAHTLVMTPQLQQAIRLLQLSHQELAGALRRELEENPLLEERESIAGEADEAAPELGEAGFDEAWSSAEASRQQGATPGDPGAQPGPTLDAHLRWQARMLRLSPTEMQAAMMLIDHVDEDGMLAEEALSLVATAIGGDGLVVWQVLQRLQELDPAGVAARSLPECLALQARRLARPHPLLATIIDHHLDCVVRGRLDRLARQLRRPREEVVQAVRQLKTLHPRPGRLFGGAPPNFVIPDIFVARQGDGWAIHLNGDGLPRLRINQLYRRDAAGADAAGRAYIQERARAAQSLLRCVQMRQRTIFRVMRSILRFQAEFFERGICALKPLVLRQVAEDVGMHESTISRVTSNKFVQTAEGTYELKFFFNPSIGCLDGDAVASQSVRSHIARLVAGEDGARPYSDQQLVEMLKASDIDVARRTVAKYREMLKILPSSRRRHVF